MPAKSKTPESAQKRIWKADLRILLAARNKISRDVLREIRAGEKQIGISAKAHRALVKSHNQRVAILTKTERRNMADIERRMGILRGRIGI